DAIGAPPLLLYAEGDATKPQRNEALFDRHEPLPATCRYAFADEEKLRLSAGETKVLADYRKVAGNAIRTIDYGYQRAEFLRYAVGLTP
ncbi:MAG TPA: hypothetical protein VEZ72_13640, partial [Paenibacillus sp.]|nr:hypothetical protein [Paenibacillus sp.]